MSESYPTLFGAWTRASSRVFSSVLEANRAALTAFGPAHSDDATGPTVEGRIEPDVDLPEWDVVHDLTTPEELTVGDTLEFAKTLTEGDVRRFAAASGDTNPIHLDADFAQDSRFGGRIVHGVLVAGLISAALARLPGSVIYLSQDLTFLAPVRIGDRVTAEVSVAEELGGGRYRLTTRILDDEGETVIDGEATVLID